MPLYELERLLSRVQFCKVTIFFRINLPKVTKRIYIKTDTIEFDGNGLSGIILQQFEEIQEYPHVRIINFHRLFLPTNIQNLQNLKELELQHNEAMWLFHLRKLYNLETLNLNNNHLEAFPHEILALKKLRSLNLTNNLLKTLPSQISSLQNLTHLGLPTNKFSSFPSHITGLQGLEMLDLNDNKLIYLPSTLCDLPKLKILDLSCNQLLTLPLNIFKIKKIIVDDNPLTGNEEMWAMMLCDTRGVRIGKNDTGENIYFVPDLKNSPYKNFLDIDILNTNESMLLRGQFYSRTNLMRDIYKKLYHINEEIEPNKFREKTTYLQWILKEGYFKLLPSELRNIIRRYYLSSYHEIFIHYCYRIKSDIFFLDRPIPLEYLDDFFAS